MFGFQMVDVLSDILFYDQMRRYSDYAREDTEDNVKEEVFAKLATVSLVFVFFPYLSNVLSSVRIVQKINDDAVTSEFTKKYFQRNAKFYSIFTLISGGAFPAVSLMNSNVLSLPIFNAGLSSLQLEKFRTHHLASTLLLENLPQLGIQGFVIFHLNVSGTIVVLSFASSVFNVMVSILTAVVFIILHRNESESKFTILVSWMRRQGIPDSVGRPSLEPNGPAPKLNPFSRTGRRVTLAKELALIDFGGSKSTHFEIMSAKKQNESYLLYGVMQFDNGSESAAGLLAKFMDKTKGIKRAIIKAFEYDAVFMKEYRFNIEISGEEMCSRSEKIELIQKLALELGVDPEQIAEFLRKIAEQVLIERFIPLFIVYLFFVHVHCTYSVHSRALSL